MRVGMPRAKLLIGGAAVTAALGVRTARTLRGRHRAGDEIDELRDELRLELERLKAADIKASGTRREPTTPPG
jgi:hypothetical protein